MLCAKRTIPSLRVSTDFGFALWRSATGALTALALVEASDGIFFVALMRGLVLSPRLTRTGGSFPSGSPAQGFGGLCADARSTTRPGPRSAPSLGQRRRLTETEAHLRSLRRIGPMPSPRFGGSDRRQARQARRRQRERFAQHT
jgi:hypothetical protein